MGLSKAGVEKTNASPTTPVAERDYWNDWPQYFSAKVNEARTRRKSELASVRTAKDVQDRISLIRAKVWDIVGGPLEKTSLNPRTVGTLTRQNYQIEKVIFESQPQVYVTANLYIPSAGKPPFPGIISPLGHYPEGKSARDYQHLFQNLARQGYVVLAFDPFGQGERQQYPDPQTGQSRYGPTGEHDKMGWPMLLLGATLARYRVWDAIRAVDYLVSRPEVDAEHVGCVGHSGGATMTMYLCALEPRIKVAVEIEGHTRNFAGPHYVPPGAVGDAEQNLVGSMVAGLDRGDLLWAFAPKPLLMAYTPQDGLERPSYVEAVAEIFEEARAAYSIMGAGEKIRLFAAFLPHEFDFFNRRETYTWFNRWLKKTGLGVAEVEFESSPPNALNCTSTGQVLSSMGGRSVVQVNADRARALMRANPPDIAALDIDSARIRLRDRLRNLLALPATRFPLEPRVLSSGDRSGVTIEEFEFHSEEQIRVPGWFVKPSEKRASLSVVLHVTDDGKDSLVEGGSALEAIVRRGFGLCGIDLRGRNATFPSFPPSGSHRYFKGGGQQLWEDFARASLILGKPALGQQVWDFLRCLDYLEARSDVDVGRTHVVGVAGGGLVALLGTALDDRPRSILCDRMLADFRSVVESLDYSAELSWLVPGVLRAFDLPQLVATLAPRPCSLLNAAGPDGETLPESLLRERYKAALDSYSGRGAPDKFRLVIEPEGERARLLLNWIENS
jgi:cephalosporin-C deacetylase-like acetyl esterase